ncbi:MAG: cell division topological specificity factor MinE [Lachnospiraceae bacterium]|nr:cell division topological specificity factor MinE [Lachnospiraceae bacterium]MBQ1241418.1 cell division topological specificity factor MinE [Lachnospiraceae bacterium]MBQ2401625.1 cell division topological specificity factor MinE [Lachnospiraceae bacterium]MBQ2405001.1 cell division topological specificity factor MinE [Lachnospiraceae bacterium]MBQ2426411.1 cell division topological specificity factor MinE [Lachnospiraceae bacterium]
MRLIEFLTKKNSGTIAKRRLQFVLIADRIGCTQEILEMIKDDMIKAISKYMEIDTTGLEIKITQVEDGEKSEKVPVLYVSVPVRVLLTKGIC